MIKDAIELLAVITGVFAVSVWVWVLFYFMLVGTEPMLWRLSITALILTVVSVYCMKREEK